MLTSRPLALCWMLLGAPLAVSGACNSGLSQGVPEVKIIAVDPSGGPVDGGTLVEITGFGFSGDVVVWFDGSPVPTTRVDDFTLVVSSPAAAAPGTVPIKVTTEFGDATDPEGFTYGDPGPTETTTSTETTTTTTTGTVAPTGLTGGFAKFVLTQISCADCFSFPSDVEIWADVTLHEPTSARWTDWWPVEGTCVVNPITPSVTAQSYDVGTFAYLTTGGVQVTLTKSASPTGPSYGATGLPLTDFVRPVFYEFSAPGGLDLGPVDMQDALLTPNGFATIAPIQLIYTDLASAWSAPFSRTGGGGISWSPTGPGTVEVQMFVFNPAGTVQLGTVVCRDWDDGTLNIPPSALNAFPAGSPLAIYLHRTEYTESVIPNNGHTLQSVAQMGVLGTGVVTP